MLGAEGIAAGDGCNDVWGVGVDGEALGESDSSLDTGDKAIGDSLGGDEVASTSDSVGMPPEDASGCIDGALLGLSLLSGKITVGASVGTSLPNSRNRCLCTFFKDSSKGTALFIVSCLNISAVNRYIDDLSIYCNTS
jgi:hypothetical protein